jgi:hypothetical protein
MNCADCGQEIRMWWPPPADGPLYTHGADEDRNADHLADPRSDG